jgi:hypothetical protein
VRHNTLAVANPLRLKRQLFIEAQNSVSGNQQEETLKDASLMDPCVVPLPASISPEVLQNGTMDSVALDEKGKNTETGQGSKPVFRDRGPILLLASPSHHVLARAYTA